ncbi:hypothetical protein [Streptomyces spiralis]
MSGAAEGAAALPDRRLRHQQVALLIALGTEAAMKGYRVRAAVAVGMPEWLSWGSGLLLIALLLWRVLRQCLAVLVRHGLYQLLEHLHEPDLDQQAAPHKDAQRT